jgi:hypothetical protein
VNEQSILMTLGSQFQVKTNLDLKPAFKLNVHYQLSFFNSLTEEDFSSKFCNNQTMQVNQEGVITTHQLDQLKNTKQCIANLLVHVTEQQALDSLPVKQQTLVYTIKVKPIFYSMLHLIKSTRSTTDSVSLLNNVQMKWHLTYHDDLGDMFDVTNTNAKYSISRNDLVDFSQLNKNLFVLSTGEESSKSTDNKDLGSSSKRIKLPYTSMSVLANAVENSFVVRTLKPGRFIMELTPAWAYNQIESRDYLSMSIDEKQATEASFVDGRQLVTRVGDLFCLSDSDYLAMDIGMDFDSSKTTSDNKRDWYTEPENIVQLMPMESQTSMILGLCLNEGKTVLKRHDHVSIDVVVKPIEHLKFMPTSAKYITNTPNENFANLQNTHKTSLLTSTSNLIQFQSANSFHSQNCSDSFEKTFYELNYKEDLIPFKCSASFYTASSKRELTYLNQLIKTKMLFFNRHWTCDISFATNSNSRLYDLLDSNQEQILDDQNKPHLIDNDPVLVQVSIETKQQHDSPQTFVHDLPFLPAFHVQTKQIQLPISRNKFYIQNLKSRNLKEFALNEHFNLILYSTRALHSHLILTTNCPTLIQIKPLLVSRGASSSHLKQADASGGSMLRITYDIVTSSELFDLNTYANILQEQNGNLYVQITCTLTQQVERVPVKFLFGMSEGIGGGFKQPSNFGNIDFEAESWYLNPFSWFLDFTSSQVLSYLFILILTLITILAILKLKSPSRTSVEQITLNAATAAAIAANQACQRSPHSNKTETSSFNPYRYFSPSAEPDFLRSRDTSQVNKSIFAAPGSPTYRGHRSPQNASPPHYSNLGESIMSPQRYNPKFAGSTGEQTRLFSINSDVPNTSYTSIGHRSMYHPEDDDYRNQSY